MEEINNKEKKSVTQVFSWTPFWTAGFLFSVGIGAIDFTPLVDYLWYQQILYLIFHYVLWPLSLGVHFSG